jgi:hypothetical protein
MDAKIKKWYSEMGKKSAKKRWAGHEAMSPEELKEYRKLKMREYRAKAKSKNTLQT